MNEQKPQPKSPLSIFFSIGDKVTKGDPVRKMSFDYYMLWVIFLAFGFVFIGNVWRFFINGYQLANLGWGLFGLAIMWFQYFNLKNIYHIRKQQKAMEEKQEDEIESIEEMLQGFKKLKGGK